MRSLTQIPGRIWAFLRESKLELGKVTWPSRPQVIRYTLAVIIGSVALAIFLGGLDIFFSWVLSRLIA